MKHTATLFSVLLFFITATVAQTSDESSEKTKRWHFALNSGTHYLHSHYFKYYSDDNRNLNFRGTFGLWFGSNINYKIKEQWYLSLEIALHTFRLAYSLQYTEPLNQNISHEANANTHSITLKPISIIRNFNLNDNWYIPVNFGGHIIIQIHREYNTRLQFTNRPEHVFEDKNTDVKIAGAGIALETGITKKLKNGELSLLIIPTPNLIYTTEYFRLDPIVNVTGSGAILKVQYAFK